MGLVASPGQVVRTVALFQPSHRGTPSRCACGATRASTATTAREEPLAGGLRRGVTIKSSNGGLETEALLDVVRVTGSTRCAWSMLKRSGNRLLRHPANKGGSRPTTRSMLTRLAGEKRRAPGPPSPYRNEGSKPEPPGSIARGRYAPRRRPLPKFPCLNDDGALPFGRVPCLEPSPVVVRQSGEVRLTWAACPPAGAPQGRRMRSSVSASSPGVSIAWPRAGCVDCVSLINRRRLGGSWRSPAVRVSHAGPPGWGGQHDGIGPGECCAL